MPVPLLDSLLKAGRLPMGQATRKNWQRIGGAQLFESVGADMGLTGHEIALVAGVARKESNFNPTAIGPEPVNARGLMQLTSTNLDRFGVSDWKDPRDNLRGGIKVLLDAGLRDPDKPLGDVLADYGGFKTVDPTAYINAVTRFALWFRIWEGVGL